MLSEMEPANIIAVMGVTGSGKSTLIKTITARDDIRVGHGMRSCTEKVSSYPYRYEGKDYVLVDTPGFDDTYRSDSEVLEELIKWLAQSYRIGTKLTGIIYLHRITDIRMQGSANRNLRMFRNLCGVQFYSNIIFGTTFWEAVNSSVGVLREQDLFSAGGFMGDMIGRGAKFTRIETGFGSAIKPFAQLAAKTAKAMQIQIEVVTQCKSIKDTSAAAAVHTDLMMLQKTNEAVEAQERERICIRLLEDERKQQQEALEFSRAQARQIEIREREERQLQEQYELRMVAADAERAREMSQARRTIAAQGQHLREMHTSNSEEISVLDMLLWLLISAKD